MSSEKPTGADNQQETRSSSLELDPMWVVGFVDGEGCCSVSIHRNHNVRTGWQINPVFHLYQHGRHREVLEAVATLFGCGHIRPKGPQSNVLTYGVSARRDLEGEILPFFEHHPLVVKRADFERFRTIITMMRCREHLTAAGFERVVRIAYSMNDQGKQRSRTIEEVLRGSSETARQGPPA